MRPALLLVLVLLPSFSLAPMAAADCFPAADETASAVGPFYHKVTGRMTRFVQLWQEDNGIEGLQLDSGMACGARPDRLLIEACVGTGGCGIGA